MGGPFFLVWSFAPLTILLVIAGFAIRSIWITITPPRKGVKQPSCEKCKYPVAGLNSLNCPECGSDLRTTGIITRPMEVRRRGGLFGAILGLTYLVLCGFGLAMLLFSSVVVPSLATPSGSTPVPTTTLTPGSGAYSALIVEQPYAPTTSAVSNLSYSAALEITLTDGSKHRVEVTPSRRCIPIADDQAGAALGPVSRATISSWMTSLGFDSADAGIAAEIDDIVRVIDITLVTPYTPPAQMSVTAFTVGATSYIGGNSTGYTSEQTYWWTFLAWLVPIGFGAIWLICLALIVMRRRRLLRGAASQPSQPPVAAPA